MFDGKTLSWIHLPVTTSTMSWVKEHHFQFSKNSLTIVHADHQTAGIGQHGRKWLSFPNAGIYATLSFRVGQSFSFLANLGQILTLSCIKILQPRGFDIKMKWPNDLLLNKQKLGGVLVETTPYETEILIGVGFGINVNVTRQQLDDIGIPATSLFVESGLSWKRDELLFAIVQQFLSYLHFLENNDFSSLAKELQAFMNCLGKTLEFSDETRSYKGICQGIDSQGRLLLFLDNRTEHIISGNPRILE